MLYENNKKNKKLDFELFKNPTSEYRGAPFWAWNCDLDEKELLRQIDIFKEMGLGGFHMHVRPGMSTKYLSDDFMHLIRVCTDHAKKNNMLAWLYDEDRWPSGAAGGYVTKDPEFRQRFLVMCPEPYTPKTASTLLGRFDIVLDENQFLKSYKMLKDGEIAEGTCWVAYMETGVETPRFNNQTYIDMLNPRATQRFIEITHETYARVVGDEFGKTVPCIFTDEPQFAVKTALAYPDSKDRIEMPWTPDLEDTFKATYGYSLIENIPQLLWNLPDGKISQVRYHFHDHVAERFVTAFPDVCGKWCDEHGILFTGHMLFEQSLHHQTLTVGDCMRAYRSFSLPGIDMLFAGFEFTTAKQAQSAVHQYGRAGMMCEMYGVTGWDFDFRGHKLHGDWQAALGVTARVQHLSWVSMKGVSKRDYPASISYQSSWHKEYSYVEDHFARVNTALTRGKPIVKIGMIHPVESYWLHFGPIQQTSIERAKLNENFANVTEWLLRACLDFDYIDESLLPSLCKTAGAPLAVGEMNYDVILVPECETLRSSTLERLEAFKAAGGRLIFMGDAPKYENALVSERGKALYDESEQIAFSNGALLQALKNERTVEIRQYNGELTSNLIYQLRQDNDGRWLFVAHCDEPYNKDVTRSMGIYITVDGEYIPELWDTLSGAIRPISYRHENGKTIIKAAIYDYDSLLIHLGDCASAELTYGEPIASIPYGTLPYTVNFSLSEPNVLLLDVARYSLDNEELAEKEELLRLDTILRTKANLPLRKGAVAQPWSVPKKPINHTVTLEFTINSEIDYANPVLALEDADVAEITFNGEKVKYQDLGFYTDIAIRKTALPPIKKGENTLTIKLPFGETTNIEYCYILGNFGVNVRGRLLTIVPLPEKIGFGDIVPQGLPFYGGVVSYHLPFECDKKCLAAISIPHYRAGVITVDVDGKRANTVAYSPYHVSLGELTAGNHTITVNAYISRFNCFGELHNADEKYYVKGGPLAWSTDGSSWTYEYRFKPEGVLSTPIFYKNDIEE